MSSASLPVPAGLARDRGESIEKILFVAGELLDDSFGHDVLRLARELRRRGKDVGLLCRGGDLVGGFQGIGIEPFVHDGLRPAAKPLRLPRDVLAPLRRFGPRLIHLFGRPLAAWGMKLSALLERPYVLTAVTLTPGRRGRLRGDWRRGSVLAVSEEIREQLVNQWHIPKHVIGVIPFGIALDDYERYRDTGGHDRTPVVGMVGPLTREHGCECFLKAAKEIVGQGHEVQFLLAGNGPERPRLRRLVRELDLEPWVTLVHHFSDYRRMIAVMDICVVPSLGEELSLNVIEAMACRKPVVATGIGAVYSIIADGVTGLLAHKGDHKSIAEKVIRLIEDHTLAEQVVDAAYEQVRERYSVRASVEQLLAFYSKCLRRVEGR